jgi:hypothetical protein
VEGSIVSGVQTKLEPLLLAHMTLTIVKKWIRNEKVTAFQSEVKNSKKQTIEHYKGQFPNTQKKICILFCCYWRSKMICRTSDGAPIAL